MGKPKPKGKATAAATEPPRSSARATVQRIFPSSRMRNKLRRQLAWEREKQQKMKEKRARREQRRKEREQLGDKV